MLHQDPKMVDIDVDHWRNLQALLLESAKQKRRIILIHENGKLLKFVHSQRDAIVRNVDRVDQPHAVAEKVFRANADKTDFVAVFERQAFDRYFGQVQDTWKADEDLDVFVQRMYATLDEYPDGIVTYPGRARDVLGLQWRLGASHEDVEGALTHIPTKSTIVLGVFDGGGLWATLVLGLDAERRFQVVTTVNPSEVLPAGGREEVATSVVAWVNRKYPPCSLGLFMGKGSAEAVLGNYDKRRTLRDIAAKGDLLANPVPHALAQVLSTP